MAKKLYILELMMLLSFVLAAKVDVRVSVRSSGGSQTHMKIGDVVLPKRSHTVRTQKESPRPKTDSGPHPISEQLPIVTRKRKYYEVDDLVRNLYTTSALHKVYTNRYPSTCECMLAKGFKSGTCYEFSPKGGKECEARKCKPNYDCVQGVATGITCMRKLNTHRIMSNGDGTCTKKKFKSYSYRPYS